MFKVGNKDSYIYLGRKNVEMYLGNKTVYPEDDSITYEYTLVRTYSQGSLIHANGNNHAILTIKRKKFINNVYDSEEYYDPTLTLTVNPGGAFSIDKIDIGRYKVTAPDRADNVGNSRTATVKATVGSWSDTVTVLQEENQITHTAYKTDIELEISTPYVYSYAPAGGVTWTATANGMEQDYKKHSYTSGYPADWEVSEFGRMILPQDITITTEGTGLSGSGKGNGTSVTWENRGTTSGSDRSGYIKASYEGKVKSVTVYQKLNKVETTTNIAITTFTLNGANGNITINYEARNVAVAASGSKRETYSSGSYKTVYFDVLASGFSVSGVGFTYNQAQQRVEVTANSGSQRNGVVTASYSGATSVQRTITQQAFVVSVPIVSLIVYSRIGTTLTLKGSVDSTGGAVITECGFEWGYTSSLGNTVTATTVQSGQFTTDLIVNAGSTVYYKAYAKNSAGTGHSVQTNVVIPNLPTVNLLTPTSTTEQIQDPNGMTIWISRITLKASASGAGITQYGFEYADNASLNNKTVVYSNNLASGQFSHTLTWGFAQTIHYRAFATNEMGTRYTNVENYRPSL